jgi:hypothetical protein
MDRYRRRIAMLSVGAQLGCPVRRRIDGEIGIARPVEIVFETTRSRTPTRSGKLSAGIRGTMCDGRGCRIGSVPGRCTPGWANRPNPVGECIDGLDEPVCNVAAAPRLGDVEVLQVAGRVRGPGGGIQARDDPLQLECSEPSLVAPRTCGPSNRRAASIPSTRGIRTSMSTTSEQGLSALVQRPPRGGTAAELVVLGPVADLPRGRAPAAAGAPSDGRDTTRACRSHRGADRRDDHIDPNGQPSRQPVPRPRCLHQPARSARPSRHGRSR